MATGGYGTFAGWGSAQTNPSNPFDMPQAPAPDLRPPAQPNAIPSGGPGTIFDVNSVLPHNTIDPVNPWANQPQAPSQNPAPTASLGLAPAPTPAPTGTKWDLPGSGGLPGQSMTQYQAGVGPQPEPRGPVYSGEEMGGAVSPRAAGYTWDGFQWQPPGVPVHGGAPLPLGPAPQMASLIQAIMQGQAPFSVNSEGLTGPFNTNWSPPAMPTLGGGRVGMGQFGPPPGPQPGQDPGLWKLPSANPFPVNDAGTSLAQPRYSGGGYGSFAGWGSPQNGAAPRQAVMSRPPQAPSAPAQAAPAQPQSLQQTIQNFLQGTGAPGGLAPQIPQGIVGGALGPNSQGITGSVGNFTGPQMPALPMGTNPLLALLRQILGNGFAG